MSVKLRQRKQLENLSSGQLDDKMKITDESDILSLLNGIIDEETIINASGEKDLSKIQHLTLRFDSNTQSILSISDLVPNLYSLTLDQSIICSVRDLGIGLRHLKTISLCGCGLQDLDGIGVLVGLKELLLCDNFIADVTPLALHENLRILNLTGNKVADISVVDSLSSCLKLRSLFLSRNPFEKVPNYRKIIASLIPNLELLDGKKLDAAGDSKISNAMILEAASSIRLMEEEMDDELRLEACIMNDVLPLNDSKSLPSPTGRNSKNLSAKSSSTSVSKNYNNSNIIPDTGSELTHGSAVVLAGNMAAAMRKRRNRSNEKDFDNEDGEHVSALDIIDSAAKGVEPLLLDSSSRKQSQSYFFTQFFKEGDISSSAMSEEQIQQALKKTAAMTTSNAIDTAFSEDELLDGELTRQLATHTTTDSPATHTRPSTGIGPRSARARSAAPPSTGRREKMNSLFDQPLDVDGDRTSREKDGHPTSGSAQRRPKSSSGNRKAFSPVPNSDPSMVQPSPRQMNSSRPQSAIHAGNDSSFSLPFRVAANDDEMEIMRSMSRKAGFTGPILAGSPAAAAAARGQMVYSTGDVSDIPSSIVHIDIVKRSSNVEGGYVSRPQSHRAINSSNNTVTGVAMLLSDEDGDEQKATQSAHIAGKGKKIFQINRMQKILDADSDSDSEDIAITHAARHRLMSDSAQLSPRTAAGGGRRRSSRPLFLPPRNDSSKNTTKSIPQPLTALQMSFTSREAPAVESERAEQDTYRNGEDSQPSTGRLSASIPPMQDPPDSSRSSSQRGSTPPVYLNATKQQEKFMHTVSSMAGMSLGFNLTGSLAAIDKWVQETHSDEDDDFDDVLVQEGESRLKVGHSNVSSRATSGCSRLSDQAVVPSSDESARDDTNRVLDFATHESDDHVDEESKRFSAELLLKKPDLFAAAPPVDKEWLAARDSILSNGMSPMSVPTTPVKLNAVRVAGTKALKAKRIQMQSPSRDDMPEPDIFSPTRNTAMHEIKKKSNKASSKSGNSIEVLPADSSVSAVDVREVEDTSMQPEVFGKGVFMKDKDIVELLRKPPKSTPALRTKGSFQDFFKGISSKRILGLLQEAYVDIVDVDERSTKVNKRMDLLREVLTT